MNAIFPRIRRAGSAACLFFTSIAFAGDWVELRTPNFTVISEASPRRTRDWAVQFEIFRRALTQTLPLDTRYADPLTIVVFESDARLKPFKPRENNRPAEMAAYFVRNGGRSYITVSIQGARDDVREVVFHEAVHWHLTAAPRQFPLWFSEGLAEVFGNFAFRGTSFTLGSFRPESRRAILVAKPMPFADLAAYEEGSLEYNGKEKDRTQLFYQESWLLVHNLMFGQGGIGAAAIARYVATPPVSPDPTADIEQGMGVTVSAIDRRIFAYMDHGRFVPTKGTFNREAVEEGFDVRAAPAPLVDLTLGSLLLNIHRREEALPYLQRAAAAMPQDPRPCEALALASEDDPSSERFARQALSLGSRNYWIHLLLAHVAVKTAGQDGAGPATLAAAAGELVECLDLNPRCIMAVEALASVVEFLPVVSVAIEAHITEAVRQYPSEPLLQLGAAYVELRHGESAKARARLAQIRPRVHPADASMLEAVKRLSSRIEQRERALQTSKNEGSAAGR